MLKKLAEAIVGWLCAKFSIYPIEITRQRHGSDAVARGMRWEAFYAEDGGLGDVLTAMRRGYFEKAALVKPGDIDALLALSLADRICAEIDGSFRAVIAQGQMAMEAKRQADQIAALPDAMRRRL